MTLEIKIQKGNTKHIVSSEQKFKNNFRILFDIKERNATSFYKTLFETFYVTELEMSLFLTWRIYFLDLKIAHFIVVLG